MKARSTPTRRAAVRGSLTLGLTAVGVGGLAGCDIDPPKPKASSSAEPRPAADTPLVGDVVTTLNACVALIEATRAAHAPLDEPLTALMTAHQAHVALLADAAPEIASASPAPVTPAARPAAALADVRRSERSLGRDLTRAVERAASGDLARILSSVAASTAQHLAALDAGGDR